MVGQLARKHDEVNLSVVELSRVITDARKQENVADIRLQLDLRLRYERMAPVKGRVKAML